MISNSVTHLRSYTNSTIVDIAGNSAQTRCGEHRCLHIERRHRHIEWRVFERFMIFRNVSECFMMFHNVLRVFHDVLLVVHDILLVVHEVLQCLMMYHNVLLCLTTFYNV